MTDISSKLLLFRKSHNLSQDELAKQLNVSRQAVSKWERGVASPSVDTLLILAKTYNISLDKLFDVEHKNSVDKRDGKINISFRTEPYIEPYSDVNTEIGLFRETQYPVLSEEEEKRVLVRRPQKVAIISFFLVGLIIIIMSVVSLQAGSSYSVADMSEEVTGINEDIPDEFNSVWVISDDLYYYPENDEFYNNGNDTFYTFETTGTFTAENDDNRTYYMMSDDYVGTNVYYRTETNNSEIYYIDDSLSFYYDEQFDAYFLLQGSVYKKYTAVN